MSNFPVVKEWRISDRGQGCAPVHMDGVCLRMGTTAALLSGNAAAEKIVQQTREGQVNPASGPTPAPQNGIAEVLLWTASSEGKREQAAPNKKEERNIKPVDICDIPEGMGAEGFSTAKKFARRWRHGRVYQAYIKYSNGNDVKGCDTPGMVDAHTVKLGWLRKLSAIDVRHQALPQELARQESIEALKNIFNNNLTENVRQYSMHCYAAVAKECMARRHYRRHNTPRRTLHYWHHRATLRHMYVRAKDGCYFCDKGRPSQYVGYWSKASAVVLPDAATSWGRKKWMDSKDHQKNSYPNHKVELGNEAISPFPVGMVRNLFRPARNREFRQSQDKQGCGDIFSKFFACEWTALNNPMGLDLGEVCT